MKALTTKQKEMLEFITWATTVAERDTAYLEFGPCKHWSIRTLRCLLNKGLVDFATDADGYNAYEKGFTNVVLK